jgi:hypothetical protein
MHQRFSIYWRGQDRALFAFRQDVVASSAYEALARFRVISRRAAATPYGVKGHAGCGHRGRWLA